MSEWATVQTQVSENIGNGLQSKSIVTEGCPSAPPGSLLEMSLLEMQIQGLPTDLLNQNL